MNQSNYEKVYVAGHRGLVGSALLRRLKAAGHADDAVITATRSELDLTRQSDVEEFLANQTPDLIIVAAAKVGGTLANSTYPADFF